MPDPVEDYFAHDENHPYLADMKPWKVGPLHTRAKPRIIQLHGASGSGKTTLVRALMEEWSPVVDIHNTKVQRQPVAQLLMNAPNRPLLLVGHYHTGCGGADTLKSRHVPYLIAKEALDLGYDVLLEGIFLSVEVHRVKALHSRGCDRHNIFMTVPMSVCEESVQLRREAKGTPQRPLKQMADFYPRIIRTFYRLRELGLPNLHLPSYGPEHSLGEEEEDAEYVRSWALATVRKLLK